MSADVTPVVEVPETGTATADDTTAGATGTDTPPAADDGAGAAGAATTADTLPVGGAGVDAAATPDGGARRRLLAPRLLREHQPPQGPHRALRGIEPGTRLSMGAVRQLLQDQALEAASGTDVAEIDSTEDKVEAAKKTPTTTADGCLIANKAWRFGGSVPNRTCDKVLSH